jgi:hypothetical protein
VRVDRTEVRESWQPRLGPVQRDKGFAVTLGEAGELSMRGTGAGGTDAIGNWNGANLPGLVEGNAESWVRRGWVVRVGDGGEGGSGC